jgi:hypothetical protein
MFPICFPVSRPRWKADSERVYTLQFRAVLCALQTPPPPLCICVPVRAPREDTVVIDSCAGCVDRVPLDSSIAQ